MLPSDEVSNRQAEKNVQNFCLGIGVAVCDKTTDGDYGVFVPNMDINQWPIALGRGKTRGDAWKDAWKNILQKMRQKKWPTRPVK